MSSPATSSSASADDVGNVVPLATGSEFRLKLKSLLEVRNYYMHFLLIGIELCHSVNNIITRILLYLLFTVRKHVEMIQINLCFFASVNEV